MDQVVNTKALVQAAVIAAVVVAAVVVALHARRVIQLLIVSMRRSRERGPILESIEALVEPRRRAISSIPLIGASIDKMASGSGFNAVHFINYVMAQALNLGASDLHLTPGHDGIALAMRIEGILYDIAKVPLVHLDPCMRRIKVMASIDVFKHDTPQDGRITIQLDQKTDVRVSVMPTIHGEKCVMRLFVTQLGLLALEKLGFDDDTLRRYVDVTRRPQGTIFFTGPTGSGKSITAYATLNAIKEFKGGKVNMVSIEDPVEFNLPFLNQTQVNEKTGLTFAVGLRSLLRQDPNVIFIGEIRDRETAEIAMQAGLTGHLILSSVHAESSGGVFARLINMGIEPFIVASASSAVIAQRLVRKLCPACRTETELSAHQARMFAEKGIVLGPGEKRFMTARGCERCVGRGFVGRTGLYELLPVTDQIREAIIAKESASAINHLAVKAGMKPIVQSGLEKARAGIVSIEELLGVVSG